MLVQFGNNWIQKIPLTAKLDSACGLVQFWLSSEFFSSNYFQIGQHVVLLHILIFPLCLMLSQRRAETTRFWWKNSGKLFNLMIYDKFDIKFLNVSLIKKNILHLRLKNHFFTSITSLP